MRVGASDHLSIDGRKLVMPSGMTVSEPLPGDGDITMLNGGSSSYVPTFPTGLGWDTAHYPFTISSVDDILGTPRSVATLNVTATSLFDAASTARSAPGATFFVSASGSDANNGLTVGAPFQSIWKAIVAANAAAVPTTIFVAKGTYYRNLNPWFNGGTGVIPAVDIALVATGGRVITGTFDAYSAPSRDGTQTNTYSFVLANAERVCDTVNLDRYGNYTQFTQVSTAALCNAQPNTWALVAGTIYINRADQVAVTRDNTHVYRAATNTLRLSTAINCYIGGQSAGDGFDMEGSQGGGVLDWIIASPGATRHVLIASNSSFKYGGGYTSTGARSVSVDSLNGLAAFFNCRADAAATDGFNFHNTNAAASMNVLTVNCSGFDNGHVAPGSNQGWTSHETVVGVDVCGYYKGNHGATCRSINTSKTYFASTAVEDDYGDLALTGSVPPTAFRVDDTATYWCERTKVLMPAATYAYVASVVGSTIHKRTAAPTGLPDSGLGTIDTVWV